MLTVEAFRVEHANQLNEQEQTKRLADHTCTSALEHLADSPYSFTVRHEGKIIACLGVIRIWEGRGEAWAILDKDCGKHFVALHRKVQVFFAGMDMKRVEAVVDCQFMAGHRWVGMLGFKMECARMRSYLPDGGDATLYVRLK